MEEGEEKGKEEEEEDVKEKEEEEEKDEEEAEREEEDAAGRVEETGYTEIGGGQVRQGQEAAERDGNVRLGRWKGNSW